MTDTRKFKGIEKAADAAEKLRGAPYGSRYIEIAYDPENDEVYMELYCDSSHTFACQWKPGIVPCGIITAPTTLNEIKQQILAKL